MLLENPHLVYDFNYVGSKIIFIINLNLNKNNKKKIKNH